MLQNSEMRVDTVATTAVLKAQRGKLVSVKRCLYQSSVGSRTHSGLTEKSNSSEADLKDVTAIQ